MTEKLRIFVSGKEGELDHERAFVMDLIHSLSLIPIGSEERPASSESMKTENTSEVGISDIYIGIFGGIYSEATIREFRNARLKNIPTLIFEKELSENDERENELKDFLREIKHPKTGLVVKKYKTVVDLKKEILNALGYCITKEFRDARRLKDKMKEDVDKNENRILFASMENTKTALLEKMKKLPFKTRFSKLFGKAEITEFKILSSFKKGERHIVKARMEGSVSDGFLDLAIKDPDGIYHWFPEPHSYDMATDNGKLTFENGRYEAQWEFILPDKSGKYIAIMGIYENKFANRETINFEFMEFTII